MSGLGICEEPLPRLAWLELSYRRYGEARLGSEKWLVRDGDDMVRHAGDISTEIY